MANKKSLNIQLTQTEAKALLRLLAPSIAALRSDPTIISNEITFRRAIDAVERVAERIKTEMIRDSFHQPLKGAQVHQPPCTH